MGGESRWFFGLLCAHHWKIIATGTRERVFVSGRESSHPFYDMQCQHCGMVKTVVSQVRP